MVPDIPHTLGSAAYFSGDEAAWPRDEAFAVIDWATRSRLAILGGEIWLPTTPGPTIPEPYIYTFESVRRSDENWDEFVLRANAAASQYVKTFEWDPLEYGAPWACAVF